jgi:hypothetical protein
MSSSGEGWGAGGEHFHEMSSSNELSRGVEDYAQQE